MWQRSKRLKTRARREGCPWTFPLAWLVSFLVQWTPPPWLRQPDGTCSASFPPLLQLLGAAVGLHFLQAMMTTCTMVGLLALALVLAGC